MQLRIPATVERVLLALTLGLIFVLTASVITPDWTQADPAPPAESVETVDRGGPSEMPSLGSVESTRYRIEIEGGPVEPRYSVFDAESGVEMGVNMTAKELGYRFPDLDLRDADFTGAPMLLMLHTEE